MNHIGFVCGATVLVFIMFFWSSRMRDVLETKKWVPVLEPDQVTSLPQNPPLVSVIVPAHNEEALIGTCLKSALDQDYPNLEIICVDDRSTDKTASVVSKLFRGRTNCKLVSTKERPVGWTGKCYALHEGVKHASGEWFAFLDADSSLNSAALRQCVNEALKRKINLLTLTPQFVLDTFWEKALLPTFAAMAAIVNPLAKVNDPNNSTATANGMFYIISKFAYERIGGHCEVKNLAVEDIGIGKRVKAEGLGILFANGKNLLKTKMYTGFSEVMNGWTRILCGAMNYRVSTVLKYLVMHILVSLPSFVIATILYSIPAREMWPSLWFLLPVACVAQMSITSCLFQSVIGLSIKESVYVALGNIMLIWMFGVMVKKILLRDALQWRGTTYQKNRYQPKHLEPSIPNLSATPENFSNDYGR